MNLNLRIKTIFTKMFLGFMLILALAALMGGILLYNLGSVSEALRRITDRTAPSIRYSTGAERYALRAILNEKNYLLLGKKEMHDQAMRDIREIYANLDRMDEVSAKYNDQALLQKSKDLRRAVEEYQRYYKQEVDLLKESKTLEHRMRMLGRKMNELSHTHTLEHKRFLEEAIASGTDQTKHMEEFHLCMEIEKEALEAGKLEKNYLLYKNQQHFEGWKKHIANLMKLLEHVTTVDSVLEHQPLLEETRKAADEYLAAGEKWIANDNALRGTLSRMREIGVKLQETALGAQEVGWQEMDRSRESALQATEKAYLTAILLAGITLITGILGALFIARRIADPIKKLTRASAAIAKGDLSQRVSVKASGEVGNLAASFNTMVESLQNTMVSRDYFDNIIRSMIDSLIVLDTEAKIQTVNPATCDLLGYTKEELMGKPAGIIFAEEEEEEVYRLFRFFREPEKPQTFRPQDVIRNRELTYKTKDGRLIPMSFNFGVLTDEAGNVTGVVAGAKDITDRKLAEAAIERERYFSENIIATIPDCLVVVDKNLRIEKANWSFHKTFQTDPAKVVGSGITEILQDKEGKLLNELKKLFVHKDMPDGSELYYQPAYLPAYPIGTIEKQGTGRSEKPDERIFNIKVRGIRIAEEEEKKILILFSDITEKKKMEQELFRSEKLASIGRLVAEMSHEILNPVNIISLKCQLMSKKQDLPPHIHQAAGVILDQVERIKQILERLLAFSRKTKPEKEACSIEEILEKTLVLYEHQMALDNIEIVRDFPSHFPQIEIDKNQMMQVFNNLVSNARDAMSGGGSLTISTRFSTGKEPETGFMEISFKDTGCGISGRDLEKIFDPFFTTKEEGKGTGLGLSVCHRIVHGHGGTIHVESRPGKGSAFIVKLPLRQEKDDV